MSDVPELTDAEVAEKYRDRAWRLNNLYFVRDSHGNKVLFKMNPVQQHLHDNLHYLNIVPKARKLGISTFFSILYLDQVLFSENKIAGIIAHRREDVQRLFKNTTLFAVENLHPWVKRHVGKPNTKTANEISFDNGGMIFVSMTTRSGTPQFLHVSEFGYICRHFPEKANEIMSGSINSVAPGNYVSIESTSEGRGGHFYELCMKAERARQKKEKLTPMDFKIHFFPWWQDPSYILNFDGVGDATIPIEYHDYFEKLQREDGINLSAAQKWWYIKKAEVNGEAMLKEYPSTLEECFRVSLRGAYYAKLVDDVYKEGRIGFFPYDPQYPVDTAWDLGMRDSMAIVFTQTIGPEIRFIDLIENSGLGLEWYVKEIQNKPYRYGKHTLPHDIGVKDLSTGVTRLETLWALGITNTVVAPKLSIHDGIERVRLLFPRFRFDEKKSQRILNALQTCRKEWDENRSDWGEKPVHDGDSHVNDAVRYFGVTWNEGFSESLYDAYGDERKEFQTVSFFG